MLQNSPTSVTVWITTSSPFEGSITATEKELSMVNCTPENLQDAVLTLYKKIENVPSAPMEFGVRTGNDLVMRGIIQGGEILSAVS